MSKELEHSDGSRAHIPKSSMCLNGKCNIQYWDSADNMATPPTDLSKLQRACLVYQEVYLKLDLSTMGADDVNIEDAIEDAFYLALNQYAGIVRGGVQLQRDFTTAGGWKPPA